MENEKWKIKGRLYKLKIENEKWKIKGRLYKLKIENEKWKIKGRFAPNYISNYQLIFFFPLLQYARLYDKIRKRSDVYENS